MSDAHTLVEIFYSYAHKDEPYLERLHIHLSMLRREGFLTTWYDRQIVAGTDWTQAIDTHLEQAAVILLLVSPDYLASDYCYAIEMQRALQRHDAGVTRVIPLLLRPCDWSRAPFARLQCLPRGGLAITLWDNEDLAWSDVTAGIRKAIETHPLVYASSSQVTHPPLWNVPHRRNPVFTGREKILTDLAAALRTSQATALSQPQAISGLAGIGKTQIAVEYAYQYRHTYQCVIWTPADTYESLVSGYVAMASLLKLPEKETQDPQIMIQAVKTWLQAHGSWLLILDNADDLALVGEFVPSVFGGHILLTTRAQSMGRIARRIEVDAMPQDVGALFLLRRVGLVAQNASLDAASSADEALARSISEELGGLPLALDQAGAYIEEVQCSLQDYQQRYRMRRTLLLKRRGGLVADHPEPVGTIWSLSFEMEVRASMRKRRGYTSEHWRSVSNVWDQSTPIQPLA